MPKHSQKFCDKLCRKKYRAIIKARLLVTKLVTQRTLARREDQKIRRRHNDIKYRIKHRLEIKEYKRKWYLKNKELNRVTNTIQPC